jgi:hypothetical protein
LFDFSSFSQRAESIVSLKVCHHSIEIICDAYFHIDEELGFFNNVGASLISTKAIRCSNGNAVSPS